MNNKLIKEISAIALKKSLSLPICLPSDYDRIFKEELSKEINNLNNNNFELVDIEPIISNEIEENLREAVKLKDNTENIITESYEKLEKNEESLLSILKDMNHKLEELTKEVYYDELTAAYNRKWLFQKYLNHNMLPNDGSLIFIDLNDFKIINDLYGHTIGDKTLLLFSSMILNHFQNEKGFNLVRYAGDEFLILLNNKTTTEAKEISDKITKIISGKNIRINKNEQNTFKIKFSYGIESFKAGCQFSDIIEIADKKMYEMKDNSKHHRRRD